MGIRHPHLQLVAKGEILELELGVWSNVRNVTSRPVRTEMAEDRVFATRC